MYDHINAKTTNIGGHFGFMQIKAHIITLITQMANLWNIDYPQMHTFRLLKYPKVIQDENYDQINAKSTKIGGHFGFMQIKAHMIRHMQTSESSYPCWNVHSF